MLQSTTPLLYEQGAAAPGINVLRFSHAQRPLLEFDTASPARRRINLRKASQLEQGFFAAGLRLAA